MSGKYFLDTNILIYTFDSSAPEKQALSRDLVATALEGHQGVISFQVIQEFLNVATRKFKNPLSFQDCGRYLQSVLAPLCDVFPSIELYQEALEVQERWRFTFYDSLIISAALSAGCERLLSEDLQHGQKVRDLTIEDPFRPEAKPAG